MRAVVNGGSSRSESCNAVATADDPILDVETLHIVIPYHCLLLFLFLDLKDFVFILVYSSLFPLDKSTIDQRMRSNSYGVSSLYSLSLSLATS